MLHGLVYCNFIASLEIRYPKLYIFPVVMYGYKSWTINMSAEELMPLNCGIGEDS